jgi:hypothetical protein
VQPDSGKYFVVAKVIAHGLSCFFKSLLFKYIHVSERELIGETMLFVKVHRKFACAAPLFIACEIIMQVGVVKKHLEVGCRIAPDGVHETLQHL